MSKYYNAEAEVKLVIYAEESEKEEVPVMTNRLETGETVSKQMHVNVDGDPVMTNPPTQLDRLPQSI